MASALDFMVPMSQFPEYMHENNIKPRFKKRMISKLSEKGASLRLRENLALARNIYAHVANALPFSSNYFQRSAIACEMLSKGQIEEYDNLLGAVELSLDMVRAKKASWERSHPDLVGTLQEALYGAIIAKQYKAGNCEENAQTGLKYAFDEAVSQRVEMFQVLGSDHRFLVIGRALDSNPKEPTSWGQDAVVLDSWAADIHPATSRFHGIVAHVPGSTILSSILEYPGCKDV